MGKNTILLVDDEQNILNSLHRLFRREGYHILMANSGEKGLEIMKENDVSLIIADYRMPNMNGLEFLIKSREIAPDVTRIILSGYAAEFGAILSAINEGGIYKFLTKPWNDDQLKIDVRRCFEQIELSKRNRELMERVKRQNDELVRLNEALVRQNKENEEGFIATIEALASLPGLKDPQISDHSERVKDISLSIGKKMNLKEEELKELGMAARLHDIGNIAVPSVILNKKEPLTQEERKIVEGHVVLAADALHLLKKLKKVSKIIRHHHESYNGEGYPDKLKGEEIPLSSRIIYLAEVYDSLITERPFRSAKSKEEAIVFIHKNRGILYDPDVVDAFLAVNGES